MPLPSITNAGAARVSCLRFRPHPRAASGRLISSPSTATGRRALNGRNVIEWAHAHNESALCSMRQTRAVGLRDSRPDTASLAEPVSSCYRALRARRSASQLLQSTCLVLLGLLLLSSLSLTRCPRQLVLVPPVPPPPPESRFPSALPFRSPALPLCSCDCATIRPTSGNWIQPSFPAPCSSSRFSRTPRTRSRALHHAVDPVPLPLLGTPRRCRTSRHRRPDSRSSHGLVQLVRRPARSGPLGRHHDPPPPPRQRRADPGGRLDRLWQVPRAFASLISPCTRRAQADLSSASSLSSPRPGSPRACARQVRSRVGQL